MAGWRRRLELCLACAGVLLAAAPIAAAQVNDSSVEFDFDDPPDTRLQLTPNLSFGAELTFDLTHARDLDLERGLSDDVTAFKPELELAFSYDPTSWFRAFLNLETNREVNIDAPDGQGSPDAELAVKQAYVNLREIFPGLSLTLGRQRFEDKREWLYDEELDGVRLYLRHAAFGLEASVSREELVKRDLLGDRSEDEPNNYFLLGRYAIGEDSEISPYLFYRDGRDRRDEDTVFIGLQSIGELTGNIDYWVELMHVRGTAGDNDIRGYGFDVGATYVADAPWEPSLTLGLAFGSGDDDPGDGADRAFRQTGLQDNNGDFNGVTSFKYYGEVLDPELSNLIILTAGLGLRPTDDSSIDLVYHHYRQHEASDELRNAGIDAAPDGRDRTIGNGVDLILGYQASERIELEAIAGAFLPGNAFADDADPAFFVGIELEIAF